MTVKPRLPRGGAAVPAITARDLLDIQLRGQRPCNPQECDLQVLQSRLRLSLLTQSGILAAKAEKSIEEEAGKSELFMRRSWSLEVLVGNEGYRCRRPPPVVAHEGTAIEEGKARARTRSPTDVSVEIAPEENPCEVCIGDEVPHAGEQRMMFYAGLDTLSPENGSFERGASDDIALPPLAGDDAVVGVSGDGFSAVCEPTVGDTGGSGRSSASRRGLHAGSLTDEEEPMGRRDSLGCEVPESRSQTAAPTLDRPALDAVSDAVAGVYGCQQEGAEEDNVACYPFPHNVKLMYGEDRHLEVACDKPPRNADGRRPERAVVIFLPGIHGGVGPCRAEGQNYDPDALFPTLARTLARSGLHCYRVSWSRQGPELRDTVEGLISLACRILRGRKKKVILVGHSFGGSICMLAAEILRRSFEEDPGSWPRGAQIGGICTLATAMGVPSLVDRLAGIPKLYIHGQDDTVVDFRCSFALHLRSDRYSQLHLLEQCGHDMLTHKAHLLEQMETWITWCINRSSTDAPLQSVVH
eukprot:CAMPEP_0170276484 /NCGR_PEP_ID=MMETSP0116_2-20130129/38226_1 /TAXON_ID=400756 /ORGANISM="Durinskia baltica, Strain CSIRO CS-38" /LENGTH=525 /DNA_ID=CAMNT_0010527755 /DNA_START=46 /DNA_END=1623 /DNA_ORIENTATION=+